VEHVASRPTLAELEERLARLSPVNPRISAADAVRAERDSRWFRAWHRRLFSSVLVWSSWTGRRT